MINKDWLDFAQIITALVAVIGVVFSFIYSRKTLLEVQNDRIENQKPYLVFEYGAHTIDIESVEVETGKFRHTPLWPQHPSGRGIQISEYGFLKNIGPGPAIQIKITWNVEDITIKGEFFKIDDQKRNEKQYNPAFNTSPAMSTHLLSNKETSLHLIPFFIAEDSENKIEVATGYFSISYNDTFGLYYKTYQKFRISTNYGMNEQLTTTFGDIIKIEKC